MSGKTVENRAGLFESLLTFNPGLKVNQIITVSSVEMLFFSFCFVLKIEIEGQTINRKPHAAKLQNSNQNSTLSWVSLIRLQELRF